MSNIVPLENYRQRRQGPKRQRLMTRISNRLLLWVITSQFLEEVWKPALVAGCAAGTSHFLLVVHEPWGVLIARGIAAVSIARVIVVCAGNLPFRNSEDVQTQSPGPEDDPPRAA